MTNTNTDTARNTLFATVAAAGHDNNRGIDLMGLGTEASAPLNAPTMRMASAIMQFACGTVKPSEAGDVYKAFLDGRVVSESSTAAGTSKVKIQIEYAQIPGSLEVWNAFVRKVSTANKTMTGVYEAWLTVVRKAKDCVVSTDGTGLSADDVVEQASAKAVKNDDDTDVATIGQIEKKLAALAGSRIAHRDALLKMVSDLKGISQHILSGKVERPDATPDLKKAEDDIRHAQPKHTEAEAAANAVDLTRHVMMAS